MPRGWNFKELLRNKLSYRVQLSRGSVHGSYCSNIGLTWALLSVPIFLCMHRWARPKVSLRCQNLRLNISTHNDLKISSQAKASRTIVLLCSFHSQGGQRLHKAHGRKWLYTLISSRKYVSTPTQNFWLRLNWTQVDSRLHTCSTSSDITSVSAVP